jgi:acyl carrier protein
MHLQVSFGCSATNPQLGRAGSAVSRLERIRGLVAGILATRSCFAGTFSDEDTLAEIGIASLDMVTLLLAVESEFNIEVPQYEITPDVFRSVSTIDALVWRLLPRPAVDGSSAAWQVGLAEVANTAENVTG